MRRTHWGRFVGWALGALLLVHGAVARAQSPVVVVHHDDDEVSGAAAVVASSAVTFGLAYGASIFVAATSTHAGDNRLYVPVLGPWLDIADRGKCGVLNASCDSETTNKVLLVGDGIIQAASAIALVTGVLTPPRTTVVAASKSPTVHLTPVTLAGGAPGMGAFGSF